eukprot:TRINITY_DN4330_c0_g2_i1.p1 TRINITY_DN4330_c0_g2~~TRINITY_DN4330_c0_g2_i1.p1  ORF type:complete len:175 (+),score=48.97 TRINITY_DN4330_c0_g2_i1:29-526(+)
MAYRRPPRDLDSMTSLRVGNLPFQTQHDDLRILFGKYGDIGDIFLPTDRNTGRPRGFAFVRYYDKRDAEDALDALNGRTFDGRDMRITVDEGRPGGPRRFSGSDRRRSRSRDRRSRSRDRRDRSGSPPPRRRDRSDSRENRRDRSDSRDRRDRKRDRDSRSKSRS